jgi:hypothetical protein
MRVSIKQRIISPQDDHLEGFDWHFAGVAATAEQRTATDSQAIVVLVEPRRKGHAALVSGDGVPHGDLEARQIEH